MPDGPDLRCLRRVEGRPARLLFLMPGALTPLDVMDPLADAAPEGTEVHGMVLPGMEGGPVDYMVSIPRTAEAIARIVAERDPEEVALVGLSTGAAISLEALPRLDDRPTKLAAISTAPPFPGILRGVLGAILDILRIAIRLRSLSRARIWRAYFQILLFGHSPPRMLEAQTARPAITPTPRLLRAHGRSVLYWRPSPAIAAAPATIRFFHGSEDTIAAPARIKALAAWLGAPPPEMFPGNGHLLQKSAPELFPRVAAFLWGAS